MSKANSASKVLPFSRPIADLNPVFLPIAVKATVETMKIQCFSDIVSRKPKSKELDVNPIQIDVAAVIGVSGANAKGAISLSFPEAVLLGLMGKMFGETFNSLNEELETGAGELLNIIYGSMKTTLSQQSVSVSPAIPSVISGVKVKVTHLVPSPCSVVEFETEWGVFKLELGITSI